jgi:hypothetical protein
LFISKLSENYFSLKKEFEQPRISNMIWHLYRYHSPITFPQLPASTTSFLYRYKNYKPHDFHKNQTNSTDKKGFLATQRNTFSTPLIFP